LFVMESGHFHLWDDKCMPLCLAIV
jgi:hypothetical protein